jgi:hypothetical protein
MHSADQKETDKSNIVAKGQMIIFKHPACAPRRCTIIVGTKCRDWPSNFTRETCMQCVRVCNRRLLKTHVST